MRISLVTTTATHYLAGNPGLSEREHSSAGDFEISGQVLAQIMQRIRAATAPVEDRKNLTHQVSFSTSRLFATAAEAFLYSLNPAGKTDRAGTLVFTIGASSMSMANAVVEPPSCRVIGCTVLLTYRASGGAIS